MDKGWLCFVTAGTAACMDLEKEKVENGWLLYSAVFSLLNRAAAEGTDGMVSALFGALLPLLLMAPVYLIRGLGAGDIKLLSVLGLTLGRRLILRELLLAFLFGAAAALWRLRDAQLASERAEYLAGYLKRLRTERRVIPYRRPGAFRQENLPFTVPIWLGTAVILAELSILPAVPG